MKVLERGKDRCACDWRNTTPLNLSVRIPTKPAMHSNLKPATYSDLKPAGVPI